MIFNRLTRLRLRRLLRLRRRQVESATQQVGTNLEKSFFGRLEHLLGVRRFVIGWLLLVALMIGSSFSQMLALSGYYQEMKPIAGGTYSEGIIGTYSNASPLFATGSVDTAVSKLIFSGLMTYDNNNKLVGDLAKDYTVDVTGKHYIVTLRPNLVWQDGQPVTADDIAFTYKSIQNPDTNSPLLTSWQGVTVTATGKLTVKFDLPSPLAAFPYSLTNGIVPKHLLGQLSARQLRSADFNTVKPVGTGPFVWSAIQVSGNDPAKLTSLIALKPFAGYHRGAPKLDSFVVRTYKTDDQMIAAFKDRDIMAMAGLNDVPVGLKEADANIYNFSLTAERMVFFKTTSGVLADTQVRQALIKGANIGEIINNLGYSTKSVREPLLAGQPGYDKSYWESSFDEPAAAAQLAGDGWVAGKDGVLEKAGQPLTFTIYAEDTSENHKVLGLLDKQWRRIGVRARAVFQSAADLQATLGSHSYDALLYGISIGDDPDVFVYWSSSQADVRSNQRLNFSEWKSDKADTSLEAGRTRSDPALRAVKYKPFLEAWQADAPALGLYQPRFLYVTSRSVGGLNAHTINNEIGRYNNVFNWTIREARVTD